jgi:hypothetical protein
VVILQRVRVFLSLLDSMFLPVIYAQTYSDFEYAASTDKWLSILMSAHRWQMRSVRAAAITALGNQKLDPFVRIQTCIRYDIGLAWAKDALVEVCTRTEPVTREESKMFDMDTMVLISRVREYGSARKAELAVMARFSTLSEYYCQQRCLPFSIVRPENLKHVSGCVKATDAPKIPSWTARDLVNAHIREAESKRELPSWQVASPASAASVAKPSQHSLYYIDDGDVVFIVSSVNISNECSYIYLLRNRRKAYISVSTAIFLSENPRSLQTCFKYLRDLQKTPLPISLA